MTRLAFLADVHADDYYPGKVDPETGLNARFGDFIRTTAWAARKARELDARVLVCAGDYTESKVPPRAPRVVKIAQAFAEGPDRQIHVRGNHDGQWGGASIVDDLGRRQGWTGFMRPGFEIVDGVAICAIPFMDRRYARTIPELAEVPDADLFRLLGEQYLTIARGLFVAAEKAGAKAAVLTGHQQLAGAQMTDSQRSFLGDLDLVVDARALASIGYAAVVFGHVHRGQTVVEGDASSSPVFYAGSIERVDFAEAEEEKRFLVLDVEPGRTVWADSIPTPARRMLTIDASAMPAGGIDTDDVRDAIVRIVNVPADEDPDEWRRMLDGLGAFVVTGVKRRPVEREASGVVIDEALTPADALKAYLAGDPDAERLLERGKGILEAVAS